MDIQFWVWLIVIVITLLVRANKKKTQPIDSDQRDFSNPPAQDVKPISFEDLLREIQAGKTPSPQSKKTPVVAPPKQVTRQYDFVDYDDDLGDENKSLERMDTYANDDFNQTYENAKKAAFSRASLEETMKLEDTEVRFNQFKEYSKPAGPDLASKYAKELQNPQSFKRALILNEILNRKY